MTTLVWDFPTLYAAMQAGLASPFTSKGVTLGPASKRLYRCNCGRWGLPQCFPDTRSFSGIPHDFICDGCYSTYERELQDITGTGKPSSDAEFTRKALTSVGAPQELIDLIT